MPPKRWKRGRAGSSANFLLTLFTRLPGAAGPLASLYAEWALKRSTGGTPPAGLAVNRRLVQAALGRATELQVNPRTISGSLRLRIGDGGQSRLCSDYFVACTDLRRYVAKNESLASYREMEDLLAHADDFRQSSTYRNFSERLRSGNPVFRNGAPLDSLEKLDAYFLMYLDLAESIRRDGLWRRRNGFWIPAPSRYGLVRSRKSEWYETNPGLVVLENGDVIFAGNGQHRRALAVLLGLTSIPVEVQMVHRDWLARALDVSAAGPSAVGRLAAALAELRARLYCER